MPHPGICRSILQLFVTTVILPATLAPEAQRRVDLTLTDLPSPLADRVKRLQEHDPDLLEHLLEYVVLRKQVFDVLVAQDRES